jgi:GNAT superfamily N-acetyltransferase
MSDIHLAETDAEIARCFPVISQLRPKLIEAEFVSIVRIQQAEGYHMAFLEHEGTVVSVAGFRIQSMLSSGKTMYVDDLVTDGNTRSQGWGKTLLEWLVERAREAGCDSFTLDSGTQRQEAHAFYFRQRLRATALHFHLPL